MSDHAQERVGEIGVEAVHVGGEDVADPCNSFVRDDAQIPDARDRVGASLRSQRLGVVGRGKENVVVEFVFVFLPVDEDEVAAATVMYAEEANAVPSRCCGGLRKDCCGRLFRGCYELGSCVRTSVSDRVTLDPPVAVLPDAERFDRPWRIRFRELDH